MKKVIVLLEFELARVNLDLASIAAENVKIDNQYPDAFHDKRRQALFQLQGELNEAISKLS